MVAAGSLPPTAFRDANKYNDSDMPVTIEVEFGTESDQYSYGVSYCGSLCVEAVSYTHLLRANS